MTSFAMPRKGKPPGRIRAVDPAIGSGRLAASRVCAFRISAALGLGFAIAASVQARAGDILRGGAPFGAPAAAATGGISPAAAFSAAQARANASDALARTTQALQAVKAMQEAARSLAVSGPNNLGVNPNNPAQQLPNVPNGLGIGALQVAPGVPANLSAPGPGENPALWQGAKLPVQTTSGSQTTVNIQQTAQQAILNWKTFNVGKQTTVNFDQSAGGANSGQWIAFNKINDPSGVPSQILGSIKAQGQVYVMNQNGIIFGGSSQVSARSFVASSLPINDNLVRQGLLNNRDAQFLFSSLEVPGGSDGTPGFSPPPPVTPSGKPGDVVVKAGAQIGIPSSGEGNGGRVMLAGPNVRNEGTISTPGGQAILAAGNQVAIAAHAGDDPSLRGLDVWVGHVDDGAGTATNSGVISASTGNVTMAGRTVNQNGVVDSTTTVTLNGRIDIEASYGAVANPNYDNQGSVGFGGPPFFNQYTGAVSFGPGSVTRILPEYSNAASVPGTALPENSQINVRGLAINLGTNAMMFAPSADVSLNAGVWPYRDTDGNRTTLTPDGTAENGLIQFYGAGVQRFLFSGGQIYLDPGSLINVAGSTDVFVPLSHRILDVEFRGAELADSPLQREDVLRGVPLTIDIRQSGVNNGRYWVGTPLGDATGLAGIIERNVAQLTVKGGTVTMRSGGSIVVQKGSTVDVSGGFLQHEGGMVQTSRLIQGGQLVDIANALPDQVYDGVYTGQFTRTFARWGVTETFTAPFGGGARFEEAYVEGANGGALNLTAGSMAVDGRLLGLTVAPPRSIAGLPELAAIRFNFSIERRFSNDPASLLILTASPTPPEITFDTRSLSPVPAFTLVNGLPADLPAERRGSFVVSPTLLTGSGFGHLEIENYDGAVIVPAGVPLTTQPGGSISLTGANVTVQSGITAPGGTLAFTAYGISPAATAAFPFENPSGAPVPVADGTRGWFTLAPGASLDARGLFADDRLGSPDALTQPLVIDGGHVSISAFSANLARGATIDVGGGAALNSRNAVTYGDAGSIEILAGRDPGFVTVLGGQLIPGSTLAGFSGAKGGSLTLQAGTFQIGGVTTAGPAVHLPENFFSRGGFTSYAIEGIGAPSPVAPAPGEPDAYEPAVRIAPGASINATAEMLALVPGYGPSRSAQYATVLRETGLRSPVSVRFSGSGSDDPFTVDVLEVRGDVIVGQGATLRTDPGGRFDFEGQTVTMHGAVIAPGGGITIAGAGAFPVAPADVQIETTARPTVVIGPNALLSAAGAAVYTPDPFGRRVGTAYGGGDIVVRGNIVASAGAVLDVSGTTATFDVLPESLGNTGVTSVPPGSGLTSPLWKLQTVAVRNDSSGGKIELAGSRMLFTDATLLGRAGGPTATGGTLSVSSGKFHLFETAQTSADINLIVTQGGVTIPATNPNPRVGVAVRSGTGTLLTGMGYFAADRFSAGGFDSLELGAKFVQTSPISFGGNVEFQGPVSIAARGSLRVAAGGVIRADDAVNLTASYAALGQIFTAPLNPDDQQQFFTKYPAPTTPIHTFPPTGGGGSLTVKADLIDIGTLVLQGVGNTTFVANNGDIRGNGILSVSGNLTLQAGQVFPTTSSSFDIFAFDDGANAGSVGIVGSGLRPAPFSAGGGLRIFASQIRQGGTLRAPFGAITLGWDGTDLDLSTPALDAPTNAVTGATIAIPVTRQVTLAAGSLTSVAAWTSTTGGEMVLPFGLSPDGNSWIDPRGVNVTVGGLPEKRITISGDSVVMQSASTVDLRGGGDLYAYRWTAGNGGSIDRLGMAGGIWSSASTYQSGDLVTYAGKTWAARVRNTAETPAAGPYWSEVAESFAIIPGYGAAYAPFAPFNTGVNAQQLGGDPGYVDSSLHIGDQVYLEGIAGLGAGLYTLLPRRYALLPGAFLVTPQSGISYGTISMPDGSSVVPGYHMNAFTRLQSVQTLRSPFEVAPAGVVNERVTYTSYYGDAFFSGASVRSSLENVQRLPADAGALSIQGNAALQVDGGVLAAAARAGRGSNIDISTFANLEVIGGAGTATGGTAAVLRSAVLGSWNADSLLLGGRRFGPEAGTSVEVTTGNIVVNNPGAPLTAGEILIASKVTTTITAGSSLLAGGASRQSAGPVTVSGDGTFVRVSSDRSASFVRKDVTGSTVARLAIGAGAEIAGAAVTLDSTYGSAIDSGATITAGTLDLGSGQISITLAPAAALTGSVVPEHLVLSGAFLDEVQQASALTLRSYRTVDVYGAGNFGRSSMERLTLSAGGLRGYGQGMGTTDFVATSIVIENSSNVAGLAAPAVASGTLRFDAQTLRFGENGFVAAGFENVAASATGGVLGSGTGSFSTPANLTISAPLITGLRGSSQGIRAGGALLLESLPGAPAVTGGLGAAFSFTGSRVLAGTDISLPSGRLTLHSTGAGQSVTVSARLDVGGARQDFFDLTRYPDAGALELVSDSGDVTLLAGSEVSVAAAPGGGNAGVISVKAAQGTFNVAGASLLGGAAVGQTSGSLILDAGSLPSFGNLSMSLNSGGFLQERTLRIRSGDVTVNNPGGAANVSRVFSLSADTGKITVTGTIDASGPTGGTIVLVAGGSVELKSGSLLTVHAQEFSAAGKGGEIRLEAGSAINGVASPSGTVAIEANSTIDLGVDAFAPGDFLAAGSSAFRGQFTGTLHLRAPRNGNDVQVGALLGNIIDASSVVVEGYKLYNQPSGLLNNALRGLINTDAGDYMNAGYAAMFSRLTAGNPSATTLGQALVIAPGVEIYNATGDLTLGTAVTGLNSEDWNLSSFRYGPRQAPGILTLRAAGDIVFNNTLSDGFTPVTANASNGNSTMWLAPLAPIVTANGLPVNTQSWSYRLAAGSDFSAADFRAVRPAGALAAGKGSVLVGEFYPAIPNNSDSGSTAAIGSSGTTENSIQITTGATNRTRFEVVRTGTGDIEIAAGRDVQLRNQFATIYTAGVRIPDATQVFAAGDFVVPIVTKSTTAHPNQGDLGTPQQNYPAQWAVAGGNVTISAQGDIGRFTLLGANVVPDSSKQLPGNWLYRRGYVDPASGLFGEGGVGVSGANNTQNVSDASASTAWWVDYSNFFAGIGALGGGDIALISGSDIINVDAAIPTSARMPGRDPLTGLNVGPDAGRLLEYGGGDLVVRAGGDVDGGVYYVERGTGIVSAGGRVTTNAARSPSLGILGPTGLPPSIIQSADPAVFDPSTWLPTALFVGKSRFDVSARGDVLLGPVTNAFLLPQGINNKFWYKTYFNTFSEDAGATVASYGGSVTHRFSVTMPGQTTPEPTLIAWLNAQNLFNGPGSLGRSSYFQPWLRLAEQDVLFFNTQLTLNAPNLVSTAFAGDINLVGSATLFPSPTGSLELAASDGVHGLQISGRSQTNGLDVTVWTSASLNLSDASPSVAPGIASPIAYANFAGRTLNVLRQSTLDPFSSIDPSFEETGSYTGQAASIITKQALHAGGILHRADPDPVRIYATGGDVSGFTLFSPKATDVFASADVTDVSFYIQNVRPDDISTIAAGRDIVPNNPNAASRSLANDAAQGNVVGDLSFTTVLGTQTNALQGDIQINGPGVLEVLAGRNIDLGTEPNIIDGTGVGITSIGNFRNPFLPAEGADVIALAGVTSATGSGPAPGLAGSSLDLSSFIQAFLADPSFPSAYMERLGITSIAGLGVEQQSIVGLEVFFRRLRDAGRNSATTGNYDSGYAAVDALLARNKASGSILSRARDIRTSATGAITLGAAGGGLTMASDIFGNPLTPPGIVTEYGGGVSIFTDQSVDIGQARIFTLRGGDVVIWSTNGDIAAGTAPKTVVTAPPTRVVIDVTSADVTTDLGGLATGGGIGVLASVAGVKAGDVDLIAPSGIVDAGDAGIRSTGNLNIAAVTVLNASNIQVAGTSTGVPSTPTVAAPNIAGLSAASNATGAGAGAAAEAARQAASQAQPEKEEELPSIITVEVLGYGGG